MSDENSDKKEDIVLKIEDIVSKNEDIVRQEIDIDKEIDIEIDIRERY